MRDTRDEPGSLNAIWPSGPIPPINSSIPPASVIFRSNSAHSASLSGAFPSRICTFSGSMSMCCKKKHLLSRKLIKKPYKIVILFHFSVISMFTKIFVKLISWKKFLMNYYLENVLKHKVMIRFWMTSRKANIFVHIEGLDIFETDLAGLEIFHKF